MNDNIDEKIWDYIESWFVYPKKEKDIKDIDEIDDDGAEYEMPF